MSFASAVTPHVPYLRRFARALSGSQASGDKYVGATIEALIADPAGFPQELGPRPALFKVFLSIWNSIDRNHPDDANSEGDSSDVVDRRLGQLTPLPRQAFLLVYVENFTEQSAADVLGVSSEDVVDLLQQASIEMAEQVTTDVLIIEDEPLIAVDIEEIAAGLGHNVIGIARTAEEATRLARKTQPGLVLADIQLADGSSGIDAVNSMLKTFSSPVIFVTAFPERLLTGKRPEPTFLMTKPFQPNALKALICQALFFEENARTLATRPH
ncbi:MAG: response regulator [Alphaproteobacteria bacterium]|nr:response regulator [Alphaproteobacteria bacterium]